ncbi:MAG TPA: class I SAM-dependent methyltransferase [Rectinemataceae bacterium]|nr:class I SAM-dependent methyltransferase [Rectinemataceae bacterium]
MDLQAVIPVKCPLCGRSAAAFLLNTKKNSLTYYRCGHCGFVRLAPRHGVPRSTEKERYLLHRNDASNTGYLGFLRFFMEKALMPYKKPGCHVLDFGSGPAPVLAEELEARGYRCDLYDPFFAKTRRWRNRVYDAILLHEVAEHIRDPGSTFSMLAAHVNENGIIAIRTRFLPKSIEDFASWWYRMDLTHVSFFTQRSLIDFFEARGFRTLLVIEPDIIVFLKNPAGFRRPSDPMESNNRRAIS